MRALSSRVYWFQWDKDGADGNGTKWQNWLANVGCTGQTGLVTVGLRACFHRATPLRNEQMLLSVSSSGASSHDSSGPLRSGGVDLDKRRVVRALLQGLLGIRLRVERSGEETQLSCAIIVSSRNHQPLFPPEQKLSCSCFYILLYGINNIKTQRTFHTQIKAVKYTVHVQMLPFKPSVMYEAHLSFMTNSPNTKSLLFTRTHCCVWYKVWTGSKNGFIRQ